VREYVAKRGERLDSIVLKEYGTLEQRTLTIVLEANSHLLRKHRLDAFDVVYLPQIEQVVPSNKGKALW